MLKKLFTIALAATAAIFATTAAHAADKILTVDMAEVLEGYDKAKASQETFRKQLERAQDEMRGMIESGRELVAQLEDLAAKANNPALTESARQKFTEQARAKQNEIRQKEAEVNAYRAQTDQALNRQRQELLNKHIEEIRDVVESIAKKEKADAVLNAAGPVLVYSSDALDITKETLKRLNK